MTVTAFASGTNVVALGTETFYSVNESGVFQFLTDMVLQQDGDIVELNVYVMTLNGGTARKIFPTMIFYGDQSSDPIKVSLPIANELTDATAIRFSIKKTHGTARDIPYKILKVG